MTNERPDRSQYERELLAVRQQCAALQARLDQIGQPFEFPRDLSRLKADDPYWRQMFDILDIMPQAIVIFDAVDGRFVFINKCGKMLYGADYLGIPFDEHLMEVKALRLDGTPYPYADLPANRALHQGETIDLEELILQRADGRRLTIFANAAPLCNSDGQIVAAVVSFMDITEHREAQNALKAHERNQTFLLGLIDALRSLSNGLDIEARASQLLGQHLNADRVFFLHVDPVQKTLSIHADHHAAGLDSLAGTIVTTRFGQGFGIVASGQPLIIEDVLETKMLSEEGKRACASVGIRSLVVMSSIRSDRDVWNLTVAYRQPRHWTQLEISLVEQVCVRVREYLEQKSAETALQVSEARFRALTLATAQTVYRMSPDWLEMTELNGLSFLADTTEPRENWHEAYIPVDERERVFAAIHASIRQKALFDLEHRVITVDGSVGWIRSRAVPLLDENGQIKEWFGVAENITPRITAEQALMDSLEKVEKQARELDAVIASIPDGLMIVGAGREPIYMNDDARKFFERYQIPCQCVRSNAYAACPCDLHALSTMTGIRTEDGQPFRKEDWPVARMFATGETIHDFILVKSLDQGEAFYTSVTAAPIKDSDGTVVGGVMLLKDISRQKQVEDRHRESEQRANALVEKLQESNQNKNRFISTLSHELRNPLAAITMSLALLKLAAGDEAKAGKALDVINRQTSHLTVLVNDLLDMTRINENRIKLRKESLDLVALVRHALSDYQQQFQERGVMLQAFLPDEPLAICADPVRLTQAISNLLQNSHKFTHPNDAVRVIVQRDALAGEVAIQVSDTGAGIEQETLSRLFQPFSQADRTLARSLGGLGLGLSIVKGIVELHGGRVTAASEGIGHGSTFTIYLPAE